MNTLKTVNLFNFDKELKKTDPRVDKKRQMTKKEIKYSFYRDEEGEEFVKMTSSGERRKTRINNDSPTERKTAVRTSAL